MIAVSDVSGGAPRPGRARHPRRCTRTSHEHGSLEGCDAEQRITNEELLELDCDILVLAAREDQVTERERAPRSARG